MAPQNSTLIHENAELASELSRYSPILTIKEEGNDVHWRKSICNSDEDILQEEEEVPIWICGEPRFISGITSSTTCNELIQALIDDEIHSNNNDVAASRDLNDYVITEKWRDVEQALTGETNILPIWLAWGSSRNEVKFKLKINKNRDGPKIDHERKQTKPLKGSKVTAVSKLLKHLIEQGESIKGQLAAIRDKPIRRKLCSQVYHKSIMNMDTFSYNDGACSRNTIKHLEYTSEGLSLKNYKHSNNNNLNGKLTPTDDELFLLIDDRNEKDDSGVHVEYRQYLLNKKLNLALEAKKLKQHTIEETPKRRNSSKRLEFDSLRRNSRLLNYLLENGQTAKFNENFRRDRLYDNANDYPKSFDGIRYEIAFRMAELNELIAYEEELMEGLAEKCERYRNQNQIYTRKLELEMCIEEVQRNLDAYAKEVIQSEIELYNVKHEIQQKCGVLHNLQRMLKVECHDLGDLNERLFKTKNDRLKKRPKPFVRRNSLTDCSFGPCDNSANKSIII